MADQKVVGKMGRVTGRIGPDRLGEVMIPIRGGTEALPRLRRRPGGRDRRRAPRSSWSSTTHPAPSSSPPSSSDTEQRKTS